MLLRRRIDTAEVEEVPPKLSDFPTSRKELADSFFSQAEGSEKYTLNQLLYIAHNGQHLLDRRSRGDLVDALFAELFRGNMNGFKLKEVLESVGNRPVYKPVQLSFFDEEGVTVDSRLETVVGSNRHIFREAVREHTHLFARHPEKEVRVISLMNLRSAELEYLVDDPSPFVSRDASIVRAIHALDGAGSLKSHVDTVVRKQQDKFRSKKATSEVIMGGGGYLGMVGAVVAGSNLGDGVPMLIVGGAIGAGGVLMKLRVKRRERRALADAKRI